jgi:hypothetical protein
MAQPIESILIVGGGTAGWLAAAYLQRALGSTVKIALVESKHIPAIGVGEATVSTLRYTMSFLGFAEEDWMARVGATYKTAVRFEQWNQPPSAGPEHFYHPFFEREEPLVEALPSYFPEVGDGISLMHFWHRRHLAGDPTPFAYAMFPGPKLCDARKSPRLLDGARPEIPSAYHLDAHDFAAFLCGVATARGVGHTRDDVTKMLLDERGFVAGVRTQEHGILRADLYVDCTGFSSVLLGKALRERFVSAAPYLWCDAAVAMRPQNASGDLEPYTLARASDAGWMWNIPLAHRSGTGYVYASRYASSDEAEHELRAYLGRRADRDTNVSRLRFTPGRYERTWVKNCVAIGLSGSFIEPLESTTIFLIEYALAQLVSFLPDQSFAPGRTARYNQLVERMFDEVRDFVILHFVSANRRDTPFWRELSENPLVPDSLRAQLAFYRTSLPVGERFSNFAFRERSYACLLAGMRRLPADPYPLLAHVDDAAADRMFAAIRARTSDLLARLPGHREYLERARSVEARRSAREQP